MREVHILWAEDDFAYFRSYHDILKAFLEERGIRANIERAENGNEVYRILMSGRFDLLIVDIEMGTTWGGIETVKDLRRWYPALPMLIVSNKIAEHEDEIAGLRRQGIITHAFSAGSSREWCEKAWQVLSIKPPAILHMSDIHFGPFHALSSELPLESLLFPLFEDIEREGEIDLIVITGDFSSVGAQEEFDRAKEFLWRVAERLDVPLDRFIFVPGNHDIYRNEESGRRFVKYIEFLKLFYGGLSDPGEVFKSYGDLFDESHGGLSWDSRKHSEESLYSVSVYDDLQIVVIGLNSVVSAEEKNWDSGRIENSQLLRVDHELNKLRPPRSHYFRIAAFHHHLFVVPSFTSEGEPERVVRNQGLLLRHLISNRVKLVLHGHTHYSIGYKYLPYYLDGNENKAKPIHVFGTGTLSGKELAKAQPYFHLTSIRCGHNDEGVISTAVVTAYQLVDDSLRWRTLSPVKINFGEEIW